MERIEKGNTVALRSGGPTMTVETAAKTEIECVWFSLDGQLVRDGFVPEVLEFRNC